MKIRVQRKYETTPSQNIQKTILISLSWIAFSSPIFAQDKLPRADIGLVKYLFMLGNQRVGHEQVAFPTMVGQHMGNSNGVIINTNIV